MDESFGAGGFDATQVGGSGVQNDQKAEGVVPLVIQQIKKAADSFQMYGMSFGMVTIVGIVRNIEHSSTKITYTIEDHTGQIDAHYWLDGDSEADSKAPSILLNTYVRIFGSVRNQGGAKVLMVFNIDALSSINELTTHLLEVLNARYMAEDFAKMAGVGGSGGGYNAGYQPQTNSFNNNFGGGASDNSLGLTGKQLMLYKAVKEYKDDLTGISKQELHKKFNHIPMNELENIMENMTTEGHIYTSIDSEHWLPTDVE
ncbi:replication protein A 32 kDa subunit [Contarinia nasturtii]|uniref:replication protein A 32 kDa subunit n=1 Tax=Contarinia nasturtii TaxID=265458 RepID=UPI0012D3E4F2|nr:replication protein A 32 kDa subunit [Contarinia nasturtii]